MARYGTADIKMRLSPRWRCRPETNRFAGETPALPGTAKVVDSGKFEERSFHLKRTTPEDMLRFLMEQNQLSQYDLARELGGQPVVSALLAGKRKLTREHIERLARRFGLGPDAFYSGA